MLNAESPPATRTETNPPPVPKAKAVDARALVPALAGVTLLGLTILLFSWWSFRISRRRLRKILGPTHPGTEQWYAKPLNPPPDNSPPSH